MGETALCLGGSYTHWALHPVLGGQAPSDSPEWSGLYGKARGQWEPRGGAQPCLGAWKGP